MSMMSGGGAASATYPAGFEIGGPVAWATKLAAGPLKLNY